MRIPKIHYNNTIFLSVAGMQLITVLHSATLLSLGGTITVFPIDLVSLQQYKEKPDLEV